MSVLLSVGQWGFVSPFSLYLSKENSLSIFHSQFSQTRCSLPVLYGGRRLTVLSWVNSQWEDGTLSCITAVFTVQNEQLLFTG